MRTSSLGRGLFTAALCCGAAVLSCAPPAARIRNVLLVTLDTTRADRLRVYGNASATTPTLDRLAERGVLFDRAFSVAPLTLTAHTSVFTGLYPQHHGVRDNAAPPLASEVATLTERLRDAGLRTGAFVASSVLQTSRGLSRGFDTYGEGAGDGAAPGSPRRHRRSADEVVDDALRWLDASDAPFFLWTHLYDAHAPRASHACPNGTETADDYDCAINFMDEQIGRLIAALDRDRRLSDTLVIVTADHGESLGEHGEDEHGIFLYEPAVRVPLIVRGPGVAPGRVLGLASLVDLMPTMMDLLHLASPPGDGISLVPALRGRPLPARGIYAESMYPLRYGWSPLRMLRDDRFKFIDAPRAELYDLDSDPFEERDVSADRQSTAAAMRAALIEIGRAERAPAEVAHVATAANRAALAALGYVSGPVRALPGSMERDPKDFIHVYNASRRLAWR